MCAVADKRCAAEVAQRPTEAEQHPPQQQQQQWQQDRGVARGGDRGNCGYWTWKVVKLQIIHGSWHISCKIWPGILRAGSLSKSASRTRNMKNYATRGTQGRSSDSAAQERRRGLGHKSSIDRRRLLHNSSLARAPARTPCQVTSPCQSLLEPPTPLSSAAQVLLSIYTCELRF